MRGMEYPLTEEVSDFADIETVSTSTTLSTTTGASQDDKKSSALKHNDAEDAWDTVQHGGLPDHLKASALVNPVPINNRRVFMFTKNTMDRNGKTDGLLSVPSAMGKESSPSTALVTRSATPPAHKKKKAGKKSGAVRVHRTEPLKVQISGWIFASLSDIQSEVSPVESVTISLVSCTQLSFVSECFVHFLRREVFV